MMTRIRAVTIVAGLVLTMGVVFAQGSATMWYNGPFEGNVTIKDGQTPGTPGYYYQPQATEYPTFAERFDRPVRCVKCARWREMGTTCGRCGLPADRYEQSQAQRGAIYSPYAIPGQYWYEQPRRSTTGPKHGMGWPYLNHRYSR